MTDGKGWLEHGQGRIPLQGRQKKCVVTIYYNSNNAQERTISEYMQNDLKKIGVELKIVGEEKQAFLDRAAYWRIRPAILPVVGDAV